jgi:hypothetical protein
MCGVLEQNFHVFIKTSSGYEVAVGLKYLKKKNWTFVTLVR